MHDKFCTMALGALLAAVLVTAAFAYDRTVLIEDFTNWG